MIVCLTDVFRVEIVQQSKDPKKVRFSDPNEVRMWAKYFGVAPSDLLVAFGFYIMRVLKARVQHSVETQTIDGMRMSRLYKRISSKKRGKPQNKDKFWIDTDFLIKSMRVWRDTRNKTKVYIGIPKNIKHPSSGEKAYKIFRWLEFGTKRGGKQIIPPRPLIYPHFAYILHRKSDYWVYFIKLLIDGKITFKG